MLSPDLPETPAAGRLKQRYRVFRRLLASNSEMLELMAALEADVAHLELDDASVRESVVRLLDGSLLLAENLNILTGNTHRALYAAHAGVERAVRETLRACPDSASFPLLVPLEEACDARVQEIGGKAAGLCRLRRLLGEAVPPGFVLTSAAYRLFLSENALHGPIRELFSDLTLIAGRRLFKERTAAIRTLVTRSPVPAPLVEALESGARRITADPAARWAVRSSAVGEDGRMSFAGQFDTVLDVATGDLPAAYRTVLASRWSDHSVLYRLATGFTEVATPMAVLVMPMVRARAAGVLYTRDPRDEAADRMVIDAVAGLAGEMARGRAPASTLLARRSRPGEVEPPPAREGGDPGAPGPLTPADVRRLVTLGLSLESELGHPLDVEWVLTAGDEPKVVQCRGLRSTAREPRRRVAPEPREAVARGGTTIVPGRAAGPAHLATTADELLAAPEGAILVVRQAGPELAAALPRAAGLVAEQGNQAGHAAALVREFGVPSLFGVPDAWRLLADHQALSLDATDRAVFGGLLWPEARERARSRARHAASRRLAGPLHEPVLALHLTNPHALGFRPAGCRSVHDIVRYAHEKAVAAMFGLGDEVGRRGGHRVCDLETALPVALAVLDLGAALPQAALERGKVGPEEVASPPFQALYRGMTRPGVSWAGRTQVSLGGFLSVVSSSVSAAPSDARQVGGRNYLMVAPDYVNLNARLAYHFAMVDAFVSVVPENNFVNFRFRGGGAGPERRDLRARFVEEALRQAGFAVDRKGDLVTAWLRRYPARASEEGLATLGALMGCARQLDMLMRDEASVRHFAERFAAGDYAAFA